MDADKRSLGREVSAFRTRIDRSDRADPGKTMVIRTVFPFRSGDRSGLLFRVSPGLRPPPRSHAVSRAKERWHVTRRHSGSAPKLHRIAPPFEPGSLNRRNGGDRNSAASVRIEERSLQSLVRRDVLGHGSPRTSSRLIPYKIRDGKGKGHDLHRRSLDKISVDRTRLLGSQSTSMELPATTHRAIRLDARLVSPPCIWTRSIPRWTCDTFSESTRGGWIGGWAWRRSRDVANHDKRRWERILDEGDPVGG